MSPDPPTAPGSGDGDVLHQGPQHLDRHHHFHPDSPDQYSSHMEAQDAFPNGVSHSDDLSTIAVVDPDNKTKPSDPASKPPTTGLHSPPDSNDVDGSTDSELSDLDEAIANAEDMKLDSPPPAAPPADTQSSKPAQASATADHGPQPVQPEQAPTPQQDEDIGEVLPDHWSGNVPIFKPNMDQFKDFKKFMAAVDSYGMQSGIIKIIPPDEWKNSLPNLDDLVKQVRVREPIKQDIMGSNGTYRQVNILHQRSYNIPQWRQLCDQSEHQPPARRGERRANATADKPKPATRSRAAPATKPSTPVSGRRGRGAKRGRGGRGGARGRPRKNIIQDDSDDDDHPLTPESPAPAAHEKGEDVLDSVEQDPGIRDEEDCEDAPPRRTGAFSRQAKAKVVQSTSARRKYSKREGSAMIDEKAFENFDYNMDISDYTLERCEELERTYWKTLTYATPLYGADLMGTLFDESTELWNLNKLPNLLDVLGTKVPGVNTAYLYLGMWKATFAWHLEDVDLYSINYLHFGAPKQWYSISQADARRFEAAMKSIWPSDAKNCDQFLRHKAFLISPSHLLQHFNIKVNKVLSYPGEFVVTYPYGYHSGYNLGYNCAEAVNFALDSWLPMGRIAKKCECAEAQDSVWVDVYEIERKLRGEPTPEYWSEEDDDDDDEDDDEDDDDDENGDRSSHAVRVKAPARKRRRAKAGKEKKEKTKKLRLRVKAYVEPPCCLCPNDTPSSEILCTDDGRKAHKLCALYLPETYIETVNGEEMIFNVANIAKARQELKCLYCRSKRGACFQCSQQKCPRSYHATCAAAGGIFVEEGDVPVFDKDGVEYKEQAFEFSCRFHRSKRDKNKDGEALDEDSRIKRAAAAIKPGETCQMQFFRKEIFAGVVVENRRDEQTLLLDILPNGSRIEVEWRWLLIPDPSDYHLPKASANALPMPSSRKAQEEINAKRSVDEPPRAGDMFVEGLAPGKDYAWAEFHTCEAVECKNNGQVNVDLAKDNQVWHYLGRTSTEAKPQYTEDPRKTKHNPKSNYLDTIPKPLPPPRPQYHSSYAATHPAQARVPTPAKSDKPYVYKPRKPIDMSLIAPFTAQKFAPNNAGPGGIPPLSFGTDPRFSSSNAYSANRFTSPSNTPQTQQAYQQPQHHTQSQFTPFPAPPRPAINPAWLSAPQASSATPQTAQAVQRQQYAPQATVPQQNPFYRGPPRSQAYNPQQQMQSRPHMAQAPSAAPAPVHEPGNAPNQSQIQNSMQATVQTPVGGPSQAASRSAWQTFKFFQTYHNRDSSRYRTPYALWGGFTNGYEGDLRKHLLKKPEFAPLGTNQGSTNQSSVNQSSVNQSGSNSSSNNHNRRSSFNMGGGLQGLTKPPSHQYSKSGSSSISPHNGAGSPVSSYASAMSPPPFPGRGMGHQRTSSVSTTTPSHPAVRMQAGSSSSQMTNNLDQIGSGTFSQSNGAANGTAFQGSWAGHASRGTSIPPISPAGIPSQQPTFLNTSPQLSLPPSPMDLDPDTHESPAEQLKQQLRRISESKESTPFGASRSRSDTPSRSMSQSRRLRTPSQSDFQHERRPSESSVTTPSELAANGVAVREFPEAPVENHEEVLEKLMFDLRRASTQSQGFYPGTNG
ncbi:unnamed protein product [Discula destructiva]